MTKYEVFEEKIAQKRAERRNKMLNETLAYNLANKTHEEVVKELFDDLVIVLGVRDMQTAQTLVF